MNKVLLRFVAIALMLDVGACENNQPLAGPKLYSSDTSATTNSPDSPNLRFEAPEFNFGKIKEGGIVRHSFLLSNLGKAPVVISEVQTTCGCTTAHWPKAPILPNHADSISIELHTQGNVGVQEKNILIFSNSAHKIIVLTIKAVVES